MADRPLNVILLAGGLRASAFRRQLGVPLLRLPFGSHPTLLDAWLSCIEGLGRPVEVSVVVSWKDDVGVLAPLARRHSESSHGGLHVTVLEDPAPWRGTGGLLKDVTRGLSGDETIVVVETSCMPPASLEAAFDEMSDSIDGVVCSTAANEPAGVYFFRRSALDVVPDEGFFDLKEQFLPAVYAAGSRLRACKVSTGVAERIADLEVYLHCVRASLDGEVTMRPVVSGRVELAPTARVLGASIVEDDVVIGDGAIVHDSVLLSGAVLGAGAVVSRSIVGNGGRVPSDALIRDSVEPTAVSRERKATPEARRRVQQSRRLTRQR